MRTGGYSASADFDSRLAHVLKEGDCRYIMLSSRMVYGPSVHDDSSLHEVDILHPDTPYGHAKMAVEKSLLDILGPERLTVLRISNVFGFEPERRSFFGMAQTRLMNEGKIVYDMSPLARRDFISVRNFACALIKIASAPHPGTYNLGSGFGLETGRIAEWLIEGYGAGELVVNKFSYSDQFWLDMGLTRKAFEIPVLSPEDLHADCLECGRMLKSWKKAA